MSKEEILSELKQILDDANGYDIDPYIIEQLIEKNKVSKETYTEEQVITTIKAFHLDSVEGNYSKELLIFCNNWINNNIINNPEDE